MRLNPSKFALAALITAAVFWTACSVLVFLFPGPMMNTSGSMFHMEMGRMGFMLSLTGFLWGLVLWSLFVGAFAFVMSSLYNLLVREQ